MSASLSQRQIDMLVTLYLSQTRAGWEKAVVVAVGATGYLVVGCHANLA
jgi:hypothetical protein